MNLTILNMNKEEKYNVNAEKYDSRRGSEVFLF